MHLLRHPISSASLVAPVVALLSAVPAVAQPTGPNTAQGAAPPVAATRTPKLPDRSVFPPDNPWNTEISQEPVDPNSALIIAHMVPTKGLHADFGTVWAGEPDGIPFCVVSGNQPKVPMKFDYAGESDPGPYPVPLDAPVEGGANSTGDKHVIVIDKDNWKLYEMWNSRREGDGWHCGSGAIFDLSSNALRPAGWTSADAAGLPIFPGLVRYDEMVEKHAINHALRFTMVHSRRAYVSPARHFASRLTDPGYPPLGMRVRLKASVDISKFSPDVQVLLTALKKYGMIFADNGGNWFISGVPDPRFSDDDLGTIRRIHGSDFEVVKMGPLVTR